MQLSLCRRKKTVRRVVFSQTGCLPANFAKNLPENWICLPWFDFGSYVPTFVDPLSSQVDSDEDYYGDRADPNDDDEEKDSVRKQASSNSD